MKILLYMFGATVFGWCAIITFFLMITGTISFAYAPVILLLAIILFGIFVRQVDRLKGPED